MEFKNHFVNQAENHCLYALFGCEKGSFLYKYKAFFIFIKFQNNAAQFLGRFIDKCAHRA